MVFEFTVSKTWIEISVSARANPCTNSLEKIEPHLKSQFQIFKATASVLHVCCMSECYRTRLLPIRREK
jgi:hypothetical protein